MARLGGVAHIKLLLLGMCPYDLWIFFSPNNMHINLKEMDINQSDLSMNLQYIYKNTVMSDVWLSFELFFIKDSAYSEKGQQKLFYFLKHLVTHSTRAKLCNIMVYSTCSSLVILSNFIALA